MEADETLGILQTAPQLIGAATPLARVQQFASRVYGPVLARGLRAWFGNAGNYWGHNAIIRTRAFADCAGLPELPGKPPFGGLILSHDFVEAALVRRGGYAVRMADDLTGSYEQAPPNLIELAARDRRWCQGNLQHIAAARRRRPASAQPAAPRHGGDVLSRLAALARCSCSPAWRWRCTPTWCRPTTSSNRWSLFPDWPRIDPERAMALFGLCMLVLYAPEALRRRRLPARARLARAAPPHALRRPGRDRALGAGRADHDAGADELGGAESSPAATAAGTPQARDADRVPWSLLWRFHRRHVLAGLLLAAAAGAISWRLLAWMSPALVGLVLRRPALGLHGQRPRRPRPRPPRAADHARGTHPAPARRGGRARGRGAARPRRRAGRRRPRCSPTRRRSRATSPGSTPRPRAAPASPTRRSPTRCSSSPTASTRRRSTGREAYAVLASPPTVRRPRAAAAGRHRRAR